MADFILISGDQVVFLPTFGAAIVVVMPGTLAGSGAKSKAMAPCCVDGDEKNVMVTGCLYTAGSFLTPGAGTLKIQALASNQKASKTKSGGKLVLLKGAMFDAVFEVTAPAKTPPPTPPVPVSDPVLKYMGKGQFITMNARVKGT